LHGIGPVIDAARDLSARVAGRKIVKVRAYVGPSVPKIARYDRPTTSHEGRFSIQYCAALGLLDRPFTARNFAPEVMHSPEVEQLVRMVEVVPTERRKMYNTAVDVTLDTGEVLLADVPLGRGHPGRPLTTEELEAKFSMLVKPVLGSRTMELVQVLQDFPRNGTIRQAFEIVSRAG
jgi:2-methylcitrate dehydratase PrpD